MSTGENSETQPKRVFNSSGKEGHIWYGRFYAKKTFFFFSNLRVQEKIILLLLSVALARVGIHYFLCSLGWGIRKPQKVNRGT